MEIPHNLRSLLTAIASQAQASDLSLYAVGGFVRDLMLGDFNADLDLVVEGDAIRFVRDLVTRYGGGSVDSPFGTAIWALDSAVAEKIIGDEINSSTEWPAYIDFASARTETYAQPAALPMVTTGATITEDLFRRDFTINAMALRLSPPPFGELIDIYHGEEDLKQGQVRVLHDQSFIDDPTRIFRAVRLAGRLNFDIEPHTLALLRTAIPSIDRLSGKRLRTEMDRILTERSPRRALRWLDEQGILRTMDGELQVDNLLIASLGEADDEIDQPRWWPHPDVDRLAVRWVMLTCRMTSPARLIKRLTISRTLAVQLEQGCAGYRTMLDLSQRRDVPLRPSEVVNQLEGLSESVLVAIWAMASVQASRASIANYARRWHFLRPTINGEDLKAMGLKPGPLFGKLLGELRRAWLDGDITTPDQERAYLRRRIAEETDHDHTTDRP